MRAEKGAHEEKNDKLDLKGKGKLVARAWARGSVGSKECYKKKQEGAGRRGRHPKVKLDLQEGL